MTSRETGVRDWSTTASLADVLGCRVPEEQELDHRREEHQRQGAAVTAQLDDLFARDTEDALHHRDLRSRSTAVPTSTVANSRMTSSGCSTASNPAPFM
jgi:hypothetical protein